MEVDHSHNHALIVEDELSKSCGAGLVRHMGQSGQTTSGFDSILYLMIIYQPIKNNMKNIKIKTKL